METQKLQKARKLLRLTKEHILDMQTIIHGGFAMDINTFRTLLKNNKHLEERFHTLQSRKFTLDRIIWKLA
jgi:hypothetical protein